MKLGRHFELSAWWGGRLILLWPALSLYVAEPMEVDESQATMYWWLRLEWLVFRAQLEWFRLQATRDIPESEVTP